MPLWKATLAYDGTSYNGWQIQPNQPTIQGTLAQTIERITGESVLPQGSGRTDTGVHALAQIATFTLTVPIPAANLHRALNRALPPSIRVLSIDVAPEGFHARHNALRKTYEYRIFPRILYPPTIPPAIDRICSPMLAPYVWDCPLPLDFATLQNAADHVRGTHDFTSFAAVDPDQTRRNADASNKASDLEENLAISTEAIPSHVVSTGAVRSNVISTGAVRSNVISTEAVRSNVISTEAVRSNVISTEAVRSNVISTGAVRSNVISTGAQRSGETPVFSSSPTTQTTRSTDTNDKALDLGEKLVISTEGGAFAAEAEKPASLPHSSNREPPTNIRTIYHSSWHHQDGLLIYRVMGNGFLHHMVRNLVGTFVEAATGRIAADDIPTILAACNRSAAGPTAPARGLFLVEVEY